MGSQSPSAGIESYLKENDPHWKTYKHEYDMADYWNLETLKNQLQAIELHVLQDWYTPGITPSLQLMLS